MRLFEVSSPPMRLLASKRFLKSAAQFMRGYPAVKKSLSEFIDFKTQHPREQFGKRDTPFTGGPLTGHNHIHLIHGKVILVYDIRGDSIRLFDIVEHNDFERSGIEKLARYIATADLYPMGTTKAPEEGLTAADKGAIDELLYEISTQERGVIDQAIAGDPVELFDYVIMLDERYSEDAVYRLFGGRDGLRDHLVTILRNLGLTR